MCCVCRYKLPKELSEYKLVCAAVQKPLFLLAVLHSLKGQSTIVFTASLEATHRCAALPAKLPRACNIAVLNKRNAFYFLVLVACKLVGLLCTMYGCTALQDQAA